MILLKIFAFTIPFESFLFCKIYIPSKNFNNNSVVSLLVLNDTIHIGLRLGLGLGIYELLKVIWFLSY